MSRLLRFLPVALLLLLVAALAWRLASPGDTEVRSQLEGKPVPAFALPPALPSMLVFCPSVQESAVRTDA